MALKVYMESLGCAKNLVDSELMLGILKEKGYELTQNAHEAQGIIINTCGFIEAAKEESIEHILSLGKLKEDKLETLIVAGCLGERYAKDLLEEIPEINAIVGTGDYEKIVEVLTDTLAGKRGAYTGNVDQVFREDIKRVISTPGYSAYLKIADGCDNYCTYCIIPKLRGKYRSRKMEDILREAEELVNAGVKELMIIAQDTTRYGEDLYQELKLPELLDKLNQIEGLRWIRVLYAYPELVTKELIESIKQNEKVVKYLDIPIQHASDQILQRMNRRTSKKEVTDRIRSLREEIPEMVIRTSLIVGFPGEGEEEFQELYDFVREMKFDRLGAFTYSKEEDTPAYHYKDQIPEEIKEERKRRIMELQQGISKGKNEEKIGKAYLVLIEEKLEDHEYIARTQGDAPEIDGVVYVKGKDHNPGEFITVKITGAMEYDLMGEIADESGK